MLYAQVFFTFNFITFIKFLACLSFQMQLIVHLKNFTKALNFRKYMPISTPKSRVYIGRFTFFRAYNPLLFRIYASSSL